jgi:fumarate reductase subunit C
MPATWWLHNRHLVLFMIRELTAVFVAAYAVFLLVLLYQSNRDEKQFYQIPDALALVLHLIGLAFVLFHSVTWFNLTPKAVILWHGEEKVAPIWIAGAHYTAWIVVSFLILIYVLA